MDIDDALEHARPIVQNNANALEDFLRLQQVHLLVKTVLSNVDPVLVPPQPLAQIQASYQTQITQLKSFESDKNFVHITNAVEKSDNILLNLYQIHTISTPGDVNAIREHISSFRKSAQGTLVAFQKENDNLKNKQNELNSKIEQTTAGLNTQKSQIESLSTQFQKNFEAKEEERRKQFDSMRAEFQKEQHQKAGAFIDELETLKAQAEKLVNVISNTGMVGGYQRTANEERKSAVRWKIATIGAMVGLIAFAIYAFIEASSSDTDWGSTIARMFAAVNLPSTM